MADKLIMIKRGGAIRNVTEKKFYKAFQDKGYVKVDTVEAKAKKASK